MKKILLFLFLVFNLFNVAVLAQEQTVAKIDAIKYFDENKRWYNEFTEHWFYFSDISEEEIRNSIVQWEKIGEDIASVENKWAGTYSSGGSTHGDYFRWSEKSGFIWLNVHKCQGGPMKITRGSVIVTPSGIQLIPEQISGKGHSNHKTHQHNYAPVELIFVKWKDASYLVAKTAVSDFTDYTAGLGEYNNQLHFFDYEPFLVRLDSKSKKDIGELPIFPAGYEKFVKKPIKGQIVSIGKSFRRKDPIEYNDMNWEDLIILVQINVGKNQGVTRNLQFYFVDNEQHMVETISVKKVELNSSLLEINRSVRKKNCVISEHNDCENHEYAPIKVGMKLSTTGR